MSVKTFKSIIKTAWIAVLATSCNTNGENKTTLAYSGSVKFNSDSTTIINLSPNGYISYTNNANTLLISNDNKGKLSYSFNGDDKQNQLNFNQKLLLKEAIDGVVKSERSKITVTH